MAIEIEGGVQSATNLLASTAPPPHPPDTLRSRDLILSQSNICLTAPPLYLCGTSLYYYYIFLDFLQISAWKKRGLTHSLGWLLCTFLTSKFSKTRTVHTVAPLPSLALPLSREYFHKLNRGGKLPQQSVSWNTLKCFSQHTLLPFSRWLLPYTGIVGKGQGRMLINISIFVFCNTDMFLAMQHCM